MKILKLLVTSVLMSALLISCTSEDATTSTSQEPATTEATTPAVEETPATEDEEADAEATEDEEVEGEGAEDEATEGEEATAEDQMDFVEGVDYIDISKYINGDMTDEEVEAGYAEYIAACVEIELFDQTVADMSLSVFDAETVRQQIVG